LWHQISAQWSEQSLINQQNAVNAQITALLVLQERQIFFQRDKIARLENMLNMLSEYVSENGRETGELALELAKIKEIALKRTQETQKE